jgi:hypothetical protein
MYQMQFLQVQIGTYILTAPQTFEMPQEVAAWHADLTVSLPGIITASAYPALYGGVPYNLNANTDVGRTAYRVLQPYAHQIAHCLLEGRETRYRLSDQFEAVWQPFSYQSQGKAVSGCSAGIVLKVPLAEVTPCWN